MASNCEKVHESDLLNNLMLDILLHIYRKDFHGEVNSTRLSMSDEM